MKTIQLGAGVNLPVELAGRRTAIFGISGSGKSNTATVIIESLLAAHEQVVLIDPKGEGWGLLSLANGKPSNLPIIAFGEPNGHIETIAESHGPRLADFVVETGRSVILSLLGFESDASERRFVASFLRQLYRRKSRTPGGASRTLVVLEEAHLFVPERVTGEGAELAGAVQRIARQGRSFGIGTLLIDQRPQDVSKRVISQCDTLICHQLSHNLDRKALEDWVKGYDKGSQGREFLDALAKLKPGQAWIWSPAWLNLFQACYVNRRQTFDTGAAPTGKTIKAPKREEVDLESLRGQLTEIVEKAKADDPKALRAKIAELQKQVNQKPLTVAGVAEQIAPKVIEQVRQKAYTDGYTKGAEEERGRWTVFVKNFGEVKTVINDSLKKIELPKMLPRGKIVALPNKVEYRPAIPPATKPPIDTGGLMGAPPKHLSNTRCAPPAMNDQANGGDLAKGERKILTAIAQYPEGCDRGQITQLTGYKATSRNEYIRQLKAKGYVVDNGDIVQATQPGIAALGDNFEPLPTGYALQDYWLNKLTGGERAIFKVIVDRNGENISRDEISEATNYKNTSRNEYLRCLIAKKIVETSTGGMVRAAAILFD